MNYLLQLAFIFILTFLTEFFIILLFLRKNPLKILLYVFLINLFTWPLANFAYSYDFNFYLIESIVVLAESVLLMYLLDLKYFNALLISFIANFITASFSFFFS
jgi:hypothetical protein